MIKPSHTGVYEAGISCIKEHEVNIWFYTKGNNTITVDAGHLNFKGALDELKKIGIDGRSIRHVLLTHSDVDHCGGVDRCAKECIFPNVQVYIGKGEENYFDGRVCRMIKCGIPLMNPVRLREGYKTVENNDIFYIDDIKVQVIEVIGHTVGHVCYVIDDTILFSGDCLAVNDDGGYSMFDFFTQNPSLNKKSLQRLKNMIEGSPVRYVCTGHSGLRMNMTNLFAYIDESAVSTRKKPFEATAPKSIAK